MFLLFQLGFLDSLMSTIRELRVAKQWRSVIKKNKVVLLTKKKCNWQRQLSASTIRCLLFHAAAAKVWRHLVVFSAFGWCLWATHLCSGHKRQLRFRYGLPLCDGKFDLICDFLHQIVSRTFLSKKTLKIQKGNNMHPKRITHAGCA